MAQANTGKRLGRRKTDKTVESLNAFKKEISDHLAEVVKVTVNGKIDKIDRKLDDYIAGDIRWKAEQEGKTGPVVNGYNLTANAWQVFISILKVFGLLGAASAGFYFFRKLITG